MKHQPKNADSGMTVGQFVETRLGKTFEEWLELTPIEFFREFWNLNQDKASPDKISKFFDSLEPSDDDSSDDAKELAKKRIKDFAGSDENLDVWNAKLELFIRDLVDPDYEIRQFLQEVRTKLPQEIIPIRHERMFNGEATGYFRLTQPIPLNHYCWFWDQFGRMIFQIDDHIYFQRYTGNDGIVMMGKIRENYQDSCFNNECNGERLKTAIQKVNDFQPIVDDFFGPTPEAIPKEMEEGAKAQEKTSSCDLL